MTIKTYTSLSETAINEVLNLEEVCIDNDNLRGSVFLDSSLNFDQQINSFFLMYEKGQLISMLSMFIPTRYEAEITAYTLPKFRGKGCFKSLLAKAVEELRKFNVPAILFVCESPSIPGKQAIKALKAEYEHTEFFMRFAKKSYTRLNKYRLSLLRAEHRDLEKAIVTTMKVFEESYEEAKSLIKNCFDSETRELYLGVLNGEIIGLGSANLEQEDVSLFGLGLVPEYRGKGYGRELLHRIVDNLCQRGRSEITIEVNSENVNALELYKKAGFHIDVAYEYYRIKVDEELVLFRTMK